MTDRIRFYISLLTMISVENLSKSYSRQDLFDRASFKINARERVGLVGRNGHGKTTLFRLITGLETPDEGTIHIPKNYRISYVRQHIEFTKDTVLKEGMKGLAKEEKGHYWKVEKILAGLGFTKSDMQKAPQTFSGGYQVRLNLAKVLVSEPDMLLLDEPSNYLDITSIRWIERFLLNWPHELILITHDRSFMDKIVTHTMGIHRKKIRKIAGTTEKYYAQIAQDEEVYEKTRINDERRRKEIELFISRFRAKARLVNLVQSRIKTLEKMEKHDRLEKIKTLDFCFRSEPFHGKYALSARELCFSYSPERSLIKDLNITIGPRDRVCVVGKNGKGKTTLLKLLAGALTPEHGQIIPHPAITMGVFEQTNTSTLVDTRAVVEEIFYSAPDVDNQKARNICGAMMFTGDDALKKIRVLSGGEKSRVMLGKLLVTPVNMLLLDEPTNHLDMESSDALLAAIDSFEGAVVIVTHNEMFLHALAERLIVFDNNSIDVFEGSYQRFLEKGGWKDEDDWQRFASNENAEASIDRKLTKKDIRRRRSEIITERGKILRPLESRIEQIEDEVNSLEKDLAQYTQKMQEASENKEGAKVAELARSIHTCQTAIDSLFDELDKLTIQAEGKRVFFEEQLNQVEQLD